MVKWPYKTINSLTIRGLVSKRGSCNRCRQKETINSQHIDTLTGLHRLTLPLTHGPESWLGEERERMKDNPVVECISGMGKQGESGPDLRLSLSFVNTK